MAPWAATVSRKPSHAFSGHVMFGAPLDVSLDRPRWLLGRTWDRTTLILGWNPVSTEA